MTQLIVNKCYGGYGLSEEAIKLYAKKKGITLYIEKDQFDFNTYWTVPESERPVRLEGENWRAASMEERRANNEEYTAKILTDLDEDRADPILIEVVRELGNAANGRFAELEIVDIPDDVEWTIEEYDGREWVAENHRTW